MREIFKVADALLFRWICVCRRVESRTQAREGVFSHPTGDFYTREYCDGLYMWRKDTFPGEWKVNKRWNRRRMTQPWLESYEAPWMEDKEQGTGSYCSWKAPRSHPITTMES